MTTLLAVAWMLVTPTAWASQEATLTRIEGQVHLLKEPSKTPATQVPEGAKRVKYENGMHYLAVQAKLGDSIGNGHFLRTETNARAQVTYPNGDQITIGPGTMYEVKWAADSEDPEKAKVQMHLLFGKMRGVVEKGGPRSKLQIRTRTATMGVRGTDFFIAAEGKSGTEVSTLRGEVEVIPMAGAAASSGTSEPVTKPVVVAVGQSVAVTHAAAEIRKTTQQDLKAIQVTSEVKSVTVEEAKASAEIDQKIATLEKKAAETALKDVQKTDPELYAQLAVRGQEIRSEHIQEQVVTRLLKTAPLAPAKRKPFRSELDDLEQGTYQKYFKQEK